MTIKGNEVEAIYPPNRIAACMIFGDDANSENLIRCVNSLKAANIDKLFIAFNGKTRRRYQWLWNHLREIKLPFLVQKFSWTEDFALARNQSFEMVPKDEFDWMLWIDSDDELIVEKPLDEVISTLDPYTLGVYLKYDYAVDPATGAVAVVQWRERILSTKVPWQWIYPVHEVVFSPSGTQFAKKKEIYIKHNRKVGEKDESTRIRNRRIIARALKENPEHPRMQFYFANEAMAEADSAENAESQERLSAAAILAFQRFLGNEMASKEDMYLAATRIGDLYLLRSEEDKAVEAYLASLKIIPEWPDAFIGLARAAMQVEDWERSKSYANIALKFDIPDTSAAITPLTHRYTPLLLRGIANDNLGLFEEALSDYKAAREIYNPNNGMLDTKIQVVEEKLSAIPADMDLRKSLRGKRPEKSIAFVTAQNIDPWHPETEKVSGCGGSETAIMRLAPRFAADGWRVAVFGTPGEHRGVDKDGVEYWGAREYLPNEQFKVVIGSRIPEAFEGQSAARHKILWMHDVNLGPRLYPFIDRVDTIVGVSHWHVNHMQRLYGIPANKFNVVPNGIELDWYDWNQKPQEENGELRVIWSSSPDRGLGTLVSLWPTIKGTYPTAKLDIFYGWNIIDKIVQRNLSPYLQRIKRDILGNIARIGGESAGIFQHGRVPQRELAKEQLKAHVWAYPTDFMETFCITSIEMQAAGVIPVASKLAALEETVCNQDLLIEGWPLNLDYQNRWLRKFEEVVDATPERQLELQLSGRSFAEEFSWDKAYSKWQDLFRRLDG